MGYLSSCLRIALVSAWLVWLGVGALPAASPLVIAHRGASGYRPEHTLAAYELAIDQGADFIEADVVVTSDRKLIARHENVLACLAADGSIEREQSTTDVDRHAEFSSRRRTKQIDGREITGWFAEDFTLAEIKTLRAVERLPKLRPLNTQFDRQHAIPELSEIIELAQRKSQELGRSIGVYIETKHPSYLASLNLAHDAPLLSLLHATYGSRVDAPVFIQSFEVENLQRLDKLTKIRLIQLCSERGQPADLRVSGDSRTYRDLLTPAGLKHVRTYADGIGVVKELVIPRDATGNLTAPTSLVTDAHREGLLVHVWTFRAENAFLPTNLRHAGGDEVYGDHAGELRQFLATGIDGFFAEQPDLAREVVTAGRLSHP